MLRVVIAEDQAILRQGLVQLLERADSIAVVDAVADYDALLAAVDQHGPDVVVTDIRMPPTGTDEGVQAAAAFRTARPELGVVVLSQYVEPAYALALLDGGSERRAYLLKERVSDVGQLVAAVETVAEGGSVIDPMVVEALVSGVTARRRSDLERLTPRETEVLREMATGKNNAAIAATLVLSERAVEKHTNAIFAKLGLTEEPNVNRRVKAVLLYLGEHPPAPTP